MTHGDAGLPPFTAAALAVAATTGPGILYVAARTLAGGHVEGLASSFGAGLGGPVHVATGTLGVPAPAAAGARSFTGFKLAGAACLVRLRARTIRGARRVPPPGRAAVATGAARAFREGVVVEAPNPETAAFFLASTPRCAEPSQGRAAFRFAAFGLVSAAFARRTG